MNEIVPTSNGVVLVSELAPVVESPNYIPSQYPLSFVERMTETKDKDADFRLGKIFYDQGNFSKAAFCFDRASDKGHAGAQVFLGDMYSLGQGFAQSYDRASYFYNKSAKQGNAEAQFKIGNMHYDGAGIQQDYAMAVFCYRQAAKKGYAPAKIKLQNMIRDGHAAPEDAGMIAYWISRIVQKGDKGLKAMWSIVRKNNGGAEKAMAVFVPEQEFKGMIKLATDYRYGTNGVKQDFKKSADLCRRAAEQGSTSAQVELANRYVYGVGVRESLVNAAILYTLAERMAGNNAPIMQNDTAIRGQRYARDNLTQGQIRKIEKLVGRWTVGTPLPLKGFLGL